MHDGRGEHLTCVAHEAAHDIHPTPVAAVPDILKTLAARSYHFVTVSRLRATL
ncbi:hypothetical protein ACWD25_53950 [Streptomyces sp. NPDC002920]